MRVVVFGTAASVTPRTYTSKGEQFTVADVHIGTAPYFDKVSMPLDLAPNVGDYVEYLANIKAKTVTGKRDGQSYTFLDVWAVERVQGAKAKQAA
jgi:hypothetical protein